MPTFTRDSAISTRAGEQGAVNDFPKLGINTLDLIEFIDGKITAASRRKNTEDFGAVNWGDIGVADIEYRMSILYPENGPYCVVIIEEAAPGCKLAVWLTDQIDKTKFPNTYVECEW
jgi:hypothetical protein